MKQSFKSKKHRLHATLSLSLSFSVSQSVQNWVTGRPHHKAREKVITGIVGPLYEGMGGVSILRGRKELWGLQRAEESEFSKNGVYYEK